jgi:hypothetical protein
MEVAMPKPIDPSPITPTFIVSTEAIVKFHSAARAA